MSSRQVNGNLQLSFLFFLFSNCSNGLANRRRVTTSVMRRSRPQALTCKIKYHLFYLV